MKRKQIDKTIETPTKKTKFGNNTSDIILPSTVAQEISNAFESIICLAKTSKDNVHAHADVVSLEQISSTKTDVLLLEEIFSIITSFILMDDVKHVFNLLLVCKQWKKVLTSSEIKVYQMVHDSTDILKLNWCSKTFKSAYITCVLNRCSTYYARTEPVDEITFFESIVDFSSILQLSSRLKRIRLINCSIIKFNGLEKFTELNKIDICACVDKTNQKFKYLSNINSTKLESFNVNDINIEDLSFLKNNPSFRNLSSLMLSEISPNPGPIYEIIKCENMSNLTEISFYNEHNLPLLARIEEFPNIKQITIICKETNPLDMSQWQPAITNAKRLGKTVKSFFLTKNYGPRNRVERISSNVSTIDRK